MNMHLIKIFFISFGTILLLNSCGNKEKQFTVQGAIKDADSLTLYLERKELSEILVLDSTLLTKDGQFSFNAPTLDYPEFYRLRLNNQNINFSIDSTETVTINANKSSFASDYDIEGSYNSSKIKEATQTQAKFQQTLKQLKTSYDQKQISDQAYLDRINSAIASYKEQAGNLILDNYTSTASYFTLFQTIDGMLIFDPTVKKDLDLFRAIATVWDTYYPNSPRTKQLRDYTLKAIKNFKALESQEGLLNMLTEGKEIENKDFFNISLPSISGKEISTQSLKGKVVLLDFTAYTAEYSVAHNIRLNQIYEKHKSKLEIYQISFDPDKHRWSNAASNLPWMCVWDRLSLNSPLISKFNIETLPSAYLMDREGNIIKKVGIDENLAQEIAKVL